MKIVNRRKKEEADKRFGDLLRKQVCVVLIVTVQRLLFVTASAVFMKPCIQVVVAAVRICNFNQCIQHCLNKTI